MRLFIYDFEFNLLLVESDIIKSRWVVYYNDVGTFEAHLPVTSELTKIVSENRYLVVKQHDLSAIIVGYEIGEELVLYGRTCNWLLTKRITPKITEKTIFAGEKAAEIVREAFSDVENFFVKNVVSGDSLDFAADEDITFSAVCKCLDLSGLGHEVCFNEKEKNWEFSVLSGKENELILSEAHKNVYDMGISFDILDYATCGTFNQETDDGYETVKIAGDESKTGIYRWEAKLFVNTENEAISELGNFVERNKFSLNAYDIFWKKDYDLGDIVRLQIIKGQYRKSEKRQIYGVEIITEQGTYTEQPLLK